MIKRLFITVMAVFIMISISAAGEIGGVKMPDTMMAGNDKLILNGIGLRKKAFIKVYAGGLYLQQNRHDPQKIMEIDEPMAIRMHFIYNDVSSKKLIKAWNKGFNYGTGGNIEPIKEKVDTFNSYFSKSAKENDIYDIIYIPDQGLSVYIKGELKGTIKGVDFKKAVFGIWLGGKPADKYLKKRMLGN